MMTFVVEVYRNVTLFQQSLKSNDLCKRYDKLCLLADRPWSYMIWEWVPDQPHFVGMIAANVIKDTKK